METKKRSFLIRLTLSALVLFPIALYGQGQGGVISAGPPSPPLTDQITANSPPIAPPLVPEGVFALELVKALKIGQAKNEAEAEGMLSAIGIEPKNGWIANYPVTPDIIGEIVESVGAAADGRKLGMGKDEAQKAVDKLVAKLGLNVMPGPSSPLADAAPGGGTVKANIYKYIDRNGVVHFTDQYESIPEEYRDQIETIGEEAQAQPFVGPAEEVAEMQPPNNYTTNNYATNNYAANPDPEVVNNYYYYYGPPVITYYEPPWPYYYMYVWVPYPFWCSRVFFYGFFILHDFHRTVIVHKQAFVVTNHVVHPRTKTVFRVDPVNRNPRGRVVVNRAAPPQVFSTPSAQASARAIVQLSQQRAQPPVNVKNGPGVRNVPPPTPLSAPQPQVSSNRGPNNTIKTPPTILNRGTTVNSAGSGSSAATGKPPVRPGTSEKRNETSPSKSLRGEAGSFSQPVQPSGRSLNSRAFNEQRGNQPRNPAVVSSPPVTREKIVSGSVKTQNQNAKTLQRPATEGGGSFRQPAAKEKAVNSSVAKSPGSDQPTPPAVMSSPRVEHRGPVMPRNTGNRNEGNIERPRVAEGRAVTPPDTSGGSFNSTPSGRVWSPPPASPNRAIPAPTPRGSGSAEGSRGGGSIGQSFSRGGWAGRF